jgi:hypothetical protein
MTPNYKLVPRFQVATSNKSWLKKADLQLRFTTFQASSRKKAPHCFLG